MANLSPDFVNAARKEHAATRFSRAEKSFPNFGRNRGGTTAFLPVIEFTDDRSTCEIVSTKESSTRFSGIDDFDV